LEAIDEPLVAIDEPLVAIDDTPGDTDRPLVAIG